MNGLFDISTSALVAQRIRLNTIASNIANVNTTRDAAGRVNPYRRRIALMAPGMRDGRGGLRDEGVHVAAVVEDKSPLHWIYDPGHPDAAVDGPHKGYRPIPNVDMTVEMVNAIEATRAYEANITAIEATKAMLGATLRIIA